jgi:hypothetical protein
MTSLALVLDALAGRVGERCLVDDLGRIILGALGIGAVIGGAIEQVDLRACALDDGRCRCCRIAASVDRAARVCLVAACDDHEK